MKFKLQNQKGFTIVELLIVIVVIGILAAITVVAYNGIQARTENAKTVSAVSAWAKALQMYKADRGSYPSMNSCLGSTESYNNDNGGTCWGADNTYWKVMSTFSSAMQPYIGSFPEPSNKNVDPSNTLSPPQQFRGAIYYVFAVGSERVYVNLLNVSTCPDISGLGTSIGYAGRSSGRSCYYNLPQ